MSDLKISLVRLVMENDLSAVTLMAQRLGVEEDAIRAALEELVTAGDLKGHMSEDGLRFFKSDVRVTDRPVVARDDTLPDFMKYDTRPGKVIAAIGLCILIAGYAVMVTAGGDVSAEEWGMLILLLGVVILMGGCCQISQRKTPS